MAGYSSPRVRQFGQPAPWMPSRMLRPVLLERCDRSRSKREPASRSELPRRLCRCGSKRRVHVPVSRFYPGTGERTVLIDKLPDGGWPLKNASLAFGTVRTPECLAIPTTAVTVYPMLCRRCSYGTLHNIRLSAQGQRRSYMLNLYSGSKTQ